MENPIKIDDLGVPLFSETSIYIQNPPVIPGEDRCERNSWKTFKKVMFGGSATYPHKVFGCLGNISFLRNDSSESRPIVHCWLEDPIHLLQFIPIAKDPTSSAKHNKTMIAFLDLS